MLKRILQCLVVCAAAAPMAVVWATDRCPPLPVSDSTCECKVQNYNDKKDDTNVTITVYTSLGPVAVCGPWTIPAGASRFCTWFFQDADNCGCQVTGEAGSSRTSLSVYDTGTLNAGASVACR